MGRRKLEMKRIEDKNSRQVTFSKRRAGLNKKARHLSILCDVDVAVVVFSSRGKLYEYCSGSTDSVGLILSRYQQRCLEEAEVKTNQQGASQEDMVGINNPSTCTSTRFRTCKELLQWVQRVDEEPNEFSVNDMTELEEELNEALMHTRSRKTQLVMERVSTFHEQERELSQEKEELKQRLQVASATAGNQKQKQKDDDEVDDGGAGLQNFAANQQQQLRTLPLFKD